MPPSDTGGFGTFRGGAGARGGRARRGRPSGASAANQTTQPSSLSTLTADRAGEYIIYRAAGLGCLGSPAVFHKMRQATRPACARSRPSATLESMIAMSSITNEGAPAPLGGKNGRLSIRCLALDWMQRGQLAEGDTDVLGHVSAKIRSRPWHVLASYCVAARARGARVPTTSERRRSPFSACRRDTDARGGRRTYPRHTPSTQYRDDDRATLRAA